MRGLGLINRETRCCGTPGPGPGPGPELDLGKVRGLGLTNRETRCCGAPTSAMPSDAFASAPPRLPPKPQFCPRPTCPIPSLLSRCPIDGTEKFSHSPPPSTTPCFSGELPETALRLLSKIAANSGDIPDWPDIPSLSFSSLRESSIKDWMPDWP